MFILYIIEGYPTSRHHTSLVMLLCAKGNDSR
jgi:hypothetical protein